MKTQKETKNFNPYDVKLDEEKQELLKSYERGEWKSVKNLAQEMKIAKETATNTLRKNLRITLHRETIKAMRAACRGNLVTVGGIDKLLDSLNAGD